MIERSLSLVVKLQEAQAPYVERRGHSRSTTSILLWPSPRPFPVHRRAHERIMSALNRRRGRGRRWTGPGTACKLAAFGPDETGLEMTTKAVAVDHLRRLVSFADDRGRGCIG